jgi:hypothetical protein
MIFVIFFGLFHPKKVPQFNATHSGVGQFLLMNRETKRGPYSRIVVGALGAEPLFSTLGSVFVMG